MVSSENSTTINSVITGSECAVGATTVQGVAFFAHARSQRANRKHSVLTEKDHRAKSVPFEVKIRS